MLSACLAAGGCDLHAPVQNNDRPLVHLQASSPEAGQQNVGTELAVRLRFDRFLMPSTVLRQSVFVTPGLLDPVTGESPAGSYFFEPRYDPYDRVAIFGLQKGGRWNTEVVHTVVVLPPPEAGAVHGFRAFDGAPLDARQVVWFTTGAGPTDPANDVDDAPAKASWCDDVHAPVELVAVRKILGRCSSVGCHGGGAPAAQMDLSDGQAVMRTARGVLAAETAPGEQMGKTAARPAVLGPGMPRIDPGSPGNSYLMYKLLINLDNYPSQGDPQAADPFWERGLPPLSAPSQDEIDRLRNAFVWLDPMPVGGKLSVTEMRTLVVWIAAGAVTADCP